MMSYNWGRRSSFLAVMIAPYMGEKKLFNMKHLGRISLELIWECKYATPFHTVIPLSLRFISNTLFFLLELDVSLFNSQMN